MKNNQEFPLKCKKHKNFDWNKAMNEARRIVQEIQDERRKQGLKHCRCCPAHPEYEDLDHSRYQ